MKTKLFLGSIIILALFLRIYQLGSIPPSPSLDEVSIGWNAYSILQTGADEYGTRFPILLRAYDDWRPAGYVYLVMPFVKLLGLNVLAVRLPSVILSILTVMVVFFLVKELFKNSVFSSQYAVFSTFLLAISPWHIYISRLGHEVNAELAFIVFAIFFFLKWVNTKRGLYLIFSALFFTLSLYTYQSAKIFVPLTLVMLIIIFRKFIFKIKKEVIISFVLSLIFLIPLFKASLDPNAFIRFKGTNIFNFQVERFANESRLLAQTVENNDFLGQVIHNRRIVAFQIFTENYVSHLDPRWLFLNTGSDRHKVPNLGLFYIWQAPLILLGVYLLLKGKIDAKVKWLISGWLIFSPLPAAITTDAPHAMRAFTLLPVVTILSALGLTYFFDLFKNFSKFLWLFSGIVSLVSLCSFYQNYFFVFPQTQSKSFQYALAQAIPYVWQISGQYEKIVFSNRDDLYQSYMFFLFFTRYDPKLYHEQGGTLSGGFAETHKFGKFEFRPIDRGSEEKNPKILYVGTPQELPVNTFKKFYYFNNQEGIRITRGSCLL